MEHANFIIKCVTCTLTCNAGDVDEARKVAMIVQFSTHVGQPYTPLPAIEINR
jgi:hypothetical protein